MNESDICNRALLLAGCARGISSLSESSTEAAVCRRVFMPCYRSLLAEHPWNWARRICVPAVKAVSVSGWAYVYELPAGCVSVNGLFNEAEANAPFVVLAVEESSGRFVKAAACDLFQASMDYTSDGEAELAPALFEEALAYRVAMEVCAALKGGDFNLREHLARFYMEAKQRAVWNDANECVEFPDEWGDEYVRARS